MAEGTRIHMITAQETAYSVVVPHCSLLGEGPVWDDITGSICWVDILTGKIHEFTPFRNLFRTLQVKDMVGAVAICNNGNFVAALKQGLAMVERSSGTVTILTHPDAHMTHNRYNDGKCDPAGRFWIGSMSLHDTKKAGSVYMIDHDLTCSTQIKGVTLSNGMAWSPDYTTFYYIDTPSFEVAAYDYDFETGQISNKRVAFTIPKKEGLPDGMTMDIEGKLWIAHWDGWQIARWDPRTGKKIFSFQMPVARVTSCTFGGSSFQDLYVTSACVGLNEKQYDEQPLAGSLFVVKDCGFQGIKSPVFNYPKK